ncbi:MAG TPA: DUF1127 domain-containing protein [Ferrovibrio sp.]|uniref:DUF1127 domain-containing protein n=1 Tax=Ferrovibrio sp. TaxID=1917215 RepID=UPI002B4B7C67|nr:DUF1127 domain-containing protein [Ferrovibrio sp.]HLT78441.1 DUF1127 domain-containing protein [Ferrovibrio sp.]
MNTLRNQTAFGYPANLAPLSAVEIEAYARRIRAEAIANMIYNAWTALKGLVARYQAYLADRRAMAELESLDDQMLRDIGLSRSQIPAAVAGLIDRAPVPAAVNENAASKVTRLVPREAA